MQISDPAGKPLGYITGTLALHAEDLQLRGIWEDIQRRRPKPDEEAEPWIAGILQKNGYRVE
jgi:hypothetical protein